MKLPFGYLEQGKDRDTLHQMAMERNSDCVAVRHVTNAWTGSDDYGCSLGEFAMEKEAFEKFRAAANEAGIRFETAAVDFCPELTLVNVEGVKRRDD